MELEEARIIFKDGNELRDLKRVSGTLAFYSKKNPNLEFFKGKMDDVTIISGFLGFEEWYPAMAVVDKVEETEYGHKFVLMVVLGEVSEMVPSGSGIRIIR